MQPRCKKCGRPLSSPDSIARGMGPECAGISSSRGKSVRVRTGDRSSSVYNTPSASHRAMPLLAWVESDNKPKRVPDQLSKYPPDLLGLVLSAPSSGTIAMRVKSYKQKKSQAKGQSPIPTLKEIRRMCINLRMLFWPGFSSKGEPLACIPCGQDKWRIGQGGREISAGNLVSYLSRCGVI